MYSGRDKMIELVQDMVDHGYYLFEETVEQFVDRMISYGFGVEFQQQCRDKFMKDLRCKRMEYIVRVEFRPHGDMQGMCSYFDCDDLEEAKRKSELYLQRFKTNEAAYDLYDVKIYEITNY